MKAAKPAASPVSAARKANKQRDSSKPARQTSASTNRASSFIKRASDSVVEGCLAVAVVAIPLYFSVLTNTSYEPDKAVLLRVLAIIAGAAWVVSLISGRNKRPILPRDPLFIAGLLVFVFYCIATALSIDSRTSFFGTHTRQLGLTTRAAFTVFFLCGLTHLRRRDQLERLITALIFGSLLAVAYGFAQEFGFNPLTPSTGDPSTLASSVRSTFGQHVLFASYLIMVIPFTAARALVSWRDRRDPLPAGSGFEGTLTAWIVGFSLLTLFALMGIALHLPSLFGLFPAVLGGYAALALVFHSLPASGTLRRLQIGGYASLLALQILTLGFTSARSAWIAAVTGVAVFGCLAGWRLFSPRVWVSTIAAVGAAILFVVVLNIPGGPLQPVRSVHGLSRLANITDSGGTTGSGRGRLLLWQGIGTLMTKTPSVGGTWGGPARDIVGYGPETTEPAFEAVFPLQLRQLTDEIWVWDRAHDIYLDNLVESGLLGLAAFLAVVSLVLARAYNLLRRSDETTSWLLIAVITAVVAHLLDGLLSLETTATVLIFWLFAGAIAAFPTATQDSEDTRPAWRPSLPAVSWFWGVILAVAAVLALFARGGDSPAPLAFLWITSTICGVGLAGYLLFRPQDSKINRQQPKRLQESAFEAEGRRRKWSYAAVTLVAVVLLISQFQFERAAIADRAGTTEYAAGDLPAAIGHLQEASRANGFDFQYRAELGALYRSVAVATRTSGPSLLSGADPWTIDPQVAMTLGRNQLFQLSIAAFESAKSLAPLLPDSYNNLGVTYLKWKKAALALNEFRQAAHLSHENPRYQDQEALAELQAGQGQQAALRARAAVFMDQSYWYSHYALALAYHRIRQHAEARIEARAALDTIPIFWPPPEATYKQQLQKLVSSG